VSKISQPRMLPLSKEFVQPEGYPSTTDLNARTGAAVARLQVRGTVPQPNPLVTAWQLHALIRVLGRAKILTQAQIDEVTYFTALLQCEDLERLVDEKPPSPLVVPTLRSNGH
jgi:hypothetical protein